MSMNKSAKAAAKDPANWVTGAEPLTARQESSLNSLTQEAGVEVHAGLTKADHNAVVVDEPGDVRPGSLVTFLVECVSGVSFDVHHIAIGERHFVEYRVHHLGSPGECFPGHPSRSASKANRGTVGPE